MNEQFKVKDICIGQKFKIRVKRNGMECEIIQGLQYHEGYNITADRISKGMMYQVRWADGDVFWCTPGHLRRKPPKHKEWAEGKVREITQPQDSVHVGGGAKHLIPEEA